MNRVVIVLLFSIAFNFSFAKTEWQKVSIPGARCGDGKKYHILIQKKASNALLVEFMGGGVCWDYSSCFERISLFPWLHGYPVIPNYSIFTANKSERNLFKEFSKIYFPYCTADVYAGNHLSNYKGKYLYHFGKTNVYAALNYLKSKKIFSFEKIENLVVYGASAGGIASLLYGKDLEQLVRHFSKKTMIVDSPGLHFGESFWEKFDEDMKKDFKETFGQIGLEIDFSSGRISKKMGAVLENYRSWRVGFVYGLKDVVMSRVFGNISPEDHRRLILSNEGLPYIAKTFNNVFFWLGEYSMHTFLLSRYTSDLVSVRGEDVNQFVKKVYTIPLEGSQY